METNLRVNENQLWDHVSKAQFHALPLQHWRQLLSKTAIEDLLSKKVFEELPDSSLDGRIDRYNLSSGIQPYHIQKVGDVFEAVPEHSGEKLEVELDDIRVLKFFPERFVAMLAVTNGLNSVDQIQLRPDFICVGENHMGGKRVYWFLCLVPDVLDTKEIAGFFSGLDENSMAVVSCRESRSASYPFDQAHKLAYIKLPASGDGWVFDRSFLNSPAMKFRAKDVADHLWTYSKISLIVDDREGGIYLFGVDLKIKKDTRAFNFISKLASKESEIDIEYFANNDLRYQNHSNPRQAAYDDQGTIRNKIKAAIPEGTVRDKALALFESPKSGTLKIPLTPDQKLFWSQHQARSSKKSRI